MARPLEELHREIRSLKADEREALLRVLVADLEVEAEAEGDVERAWLDEAYRRKKELDEGLVEAVPAAEVFARVRTRLKK